VIDAGEYNDTITMYLSSGGSLRLIDNARGAGAGSFNLPADVFGVSGAIVVGGTPYCVVAGTSSGVQVLDLMNGGLTAVGSVTNYDLSIAQGLDAFLRPGGTNLSEVVVGIERGTTTPRLDVYGAAVFLRFYNAAFIKGFDISGSPRDVSFDVAGESVWFGTTGGELYDRPFDYSGYAVAPPELRLGVTNGSVTVVWTGRTLAASADLTNWTVVASAPMSPTQILVPPVYVETMTNLARFFRARW
jgi:hypothetical protein